MAKTKYAFPHDVGHLHEPNTAGMALRDFFAAAVITGIFSGKWGQVPSQKPEVAFADIAYLVADEMLNKKRIHCDSIYACLRSVKCIYDAVVLITFYCCQLLVSFKSWISRFRSWHSH